MDLKYKIATIVLAATRVVIECPFCGRTLISTPYDRIAGLLDGDGTVKGKVCKKCGAMALLKFGAKIREEIRSRILELNASEAG